VRAESTALAQGNQGRAHPHAIHRLIVIDKLKKPPLTRHKTATPITHAILMKSNYNHNKHPTTRTKANHGETTEGGVNVGITGGIITVTPSIIARGPALV
jgi:hypothetical protein